MANGGKPNRPLRPRGGAGPGNRRRRVVIDNQAARPRQDQRQARGGQADGARREARPTDPCTALRSRLRRIRRHRPRPLAGAGRADAEPDQDPHEPRPDADGDAVADRRGGRADRDRARARGHDQARRRGRRGARGVRRSGGGARHAPAGGHDHGPRRPRQDDAARRDPQDARRRHRGGRDHAAHRRVPGRRQRTEDHVPRHAGPRGVHGDARTRREGDGHRRPRRRRRRRRHAADEGVDLARARGRGADRRRHQQDRSPRREPRPREGRAGAGRAAAGGVGRHDAVLRGVGEVAAEPRRPAREDPARHRPRARPEGESERGGVGTDHRVAPRRRSRPGRDPARPPRHAAGSATRSSRATRTGA